MPVSFEKGVVLVSNTISSPVRLLALVFLRLCLTLSSHGLSDLILNFDIFSRQKLGVEIFCVCVKLIIHHSFPEAAAAALAEKQDLVLLDELLKKAQKAREVQAKVNKMQKVFLMLLC